MELRHVERDDPTAGAGRMEGRHSAWAEIHGTRTLVNRAGCKRWVRSVTEDALGDAPLASDISQVDSRSVGRSHRVPRHAEADAKPVGISGWCAHHRRILRGPVTRGICTEGDLADLLQSNRRAACV